MFDDGFALLDIVIEVELYSSIYVTFFYLFFDCTAIKGPFQGVGVFIFNVIFVDL